MKAPPVLPPRPFTWPQAKAAGFSRWRLDELVREGRVRRVVYNVYQPADLPDTIENRVIAASLAVTGRAVFCDRTAAWMHGVDVLKHAELEILPDLDCVVPSGTNRVRTGGCIGGERELRREDICEAFGVLVTTPVRTAFDLACVMSRWDAFATLEQFMHICGVTTAEMLALLPRFRGRRGVVQLRGLIPLASADSESRGESWVKIAIHDNDIAMPEQQYWVEDHGEPVFRLDLAYPRHKLAVEYDGREFHDMSDEQREADRERRAWLRDRGWHVIVLTKDSFRQGELDAWLDELRAELSTRRPNRLRRH